MSIQSLRDRSEGVVFKVVIGIIIISFALFGFGSITTFLAPTPKVATVNGQDVTQQEMEVAVERSRRLLLAQGQTPSQIDEDKLRKDVLQNLVNRKLLSVAADDLGLFYGDARLDEEIVATPVFQIEGVFSPEQFQMVVGSAGYSPLTYRAEMRTDKKLQQLARGIQSSAFLTERDVRRSSMLAQQTRDIAFLRIDVDGLTQKVDVTGAEIEDYYKNHPAEFMTQETVTLSYIELNRSDLMKEITVTDDELANFFEETRALYAEEENRQVAHILIEVNDDVSEAQALSKAEDVYKAIQSGGDFAKLAKEFSQDPGSAQEGGDLGFNPRGSFVEEFEEAAYGLAVNEVTPPVKTDFGFHIIKLLGLEPAREPSLAEVHDKVETAYREARAEELFVKKSAELSELAFESRDLVVPSEELKLAIKTTGPVGRNQSEGIAADEGVIDAAFSADVLIDGNNSKLIEITPNQHVVVRVTDHQSQELKPLAAVAAAVTAILAQEKAVLLAKSQAEEIVSQLESGAVTRYVADQYGLEWQVVATAGRNQTGVDREINTEAFKLPRPPEGSKSVGYTLLADGDAAVISVTNVINKSQDEIGADELKSLGRILANQQGGYDYREFRADLAEGGDVTRVN